MNSVLKNASYLATCTPVLYITYTYTYINVEDFKKRQKMNPIHSLFFSITSLPTIVLLLLDQPVL